MRFSSSIKYALIVGFVGAIGPLAFPAVSQGGPMVDPGFDLLQTQPGTLFDPDGAGGPTPPIPFQGTGGADTIVERKAGATAPSTGMIPIELVALQLMSAEPVGPGGSFLFVTLQRDRGGPASTGEMTIDFTLDAQGNPIEPPPGQPHGTFDSFFDVFFDVRIDSPTGQIIQSGEDRVTANDVPWCHNDAIPGSFVPGCGEPFEERGNFSAIHRVRRVPAPSALLLLGSGVVAFRVLTWRAMRSKNSHATAGRR